MSNFAARNLSLGQVNALVKKLGGEAVVLGIIAGTTKFTLEVVEGEFFDEAAFFQTRSGLWVDPDLDRHVGLQTRPTLGAKMLKAPRVLTQDEIEATMFGQPGSAQYVETLANAVDLGQIAELIKAQERGESGVLLKNSHTNIFPVRGKDGALCFMDVNYGAARREWYVYCHQFGAVGVWYAGNQVFSN